MDNLISRVSTVILFFSTLVLPIEAFSTTTRFHEDLSLDSFRSGFFDQTSATADGFLVLTPSLKELYRSDDTYIWSLTSDPQGRIYAGLGNKGVVIRINPSDGNVEDVFKSDGTAIFSLLWARDLLYAGVSPQGQLWSIAEEEEPKLVYDFENSYIWDVVVHPTKPHIFYVALGDSAEIGVLDVKAKTYVRLFSAPDESHFNNILHLKGKIWFSSVGKGLIYAFDITEKDAVDVKVHYDSAEEEIGDLVVHPDGESLYFSTSTRKPYPGMSRVGSDAFSVYRHRRSDKGRTKNLGKKNQKPSSSSPQSESKGRQRVKARLVNTIYKLDLSGSDVRSTRLASFNDRVLPSLLANKDGSLYIGSGDNGQLIYLDKLGVPRILFEFNDKFISSIERLPNGNIIIGNGATASIHELRASGSRNGSFTSRVFDSQGMASYGHMGWHVEKEINGDVAFFSRTGPTGRPDETWSNWSGPMSRAAAEKIKSPENRYFQYRLQLSSSHDESDGIESDSSPKVYRIRIPYIRRNTAPLISRFVVSRESKGMSAASGLNPFNKIARTRVADAIKFKWHAKDAEADIIIYDVSIQSQDDGRWIPLLKNYRSNQMTMPVTQLPSGSYRFRLEASDRPSNIAATALHDEWITEPFVVDYDAPLVEILSLKQRGDSIYVKVRATDKGSTVSKILYSIDYHSWQAIGEPNIFLDRREIEFEFEVSTLPLSSSSTNGLRTLVIMVEDEWSNARTVVKSFSLSP